MSQTQKAAAVFALSALVYIVFLFLADNDQTESNRSENAHTSPENTSKPNLFSRAEPSGAKATTILDQAQTQPPFPSTRAWDEATVVNERVQLPASQEAGPILRHRIIRDKGFGFPIRVTDAIELDDQGNQRKIAEISAYAANQILLCSASPLRQQDIEDIEQALGWEYVEAQSTLFVAVLQTKEEEFEAVAEALSAIDLSDAEIEAEPNHIFYASLSPNDPSYLSNEQWGLNAENDIDIDAPEAWDSRNTAANITIAIIDTGIRLDHEDLAGNLWVNPGEFAGNSGDDDNNGHIDDIHGYNALTPTGPPTDDNGHGTHVAGIAGAIGNNSKGIAGVAWEVQLMAVKALNSDGKGSTSNIVKGIDYAVENGAHIINASWGSESDSVSISQAIERAKNKAILFVAAAGNEGSSRASFPGRSPLNNVITVGSVDQFGSSSHFSNQSNTDVDIMAPGERILSTWHDAPDAYSLQDGTSMAAPLVSGALALTLAQYPNDSLAIQKQRLLDSSVKNEFLQFACASSGIVNLNNALAMAHVPIPPRILDTSNKSIEAYEGEAVEIWAKAESDLPLSFEWFHGDTTLANETDTLTFPAITAAQTGTYRLEISNKDATLTVVFNLIVRPRLYEIEALIANDILVFGSALEHWELVEENGITSITHKALPRDTQAFLTFRSSRPGLLRIQAKRLLDQKSQYQTIIAGTGIYRSIYKQIWETFDVSTESDAGVSATIEHSNEYYGATSDPRILHIQIPRYYEPDKLPPVFRERLSSGTYSVGTVAYLQVLTEQKNVTYQWYKDGLLIEGETSHDLSFTISSQSQEGSYHVVATNQYGSLQSSAATIEVDTSPQPARIVYEGDDPLTVPAGEPFRIPMSVFGAEPILYQWYRNHQPIPGATSKELDIGIATPAHNGVYYLEAKNERGGWYVERSRWLSVQVSEQIFPPRFAKNDKEPKEYIVAQGQSITLGSRSAAGSLPIEYHWYKDGKIQTDLPSTPSITIDPAKTEDDGTYYTEARNSIGTAQSGRHSLQVTPPIDHAHDEPGLRLLTNLPRGDNYHSLVNQSHETYDGVDALELSVSTSGQQIIAFEKLGQDVLLKYRWKSSIPDDFELRYRNAQYKWEELTGDGTWKEEVILLRAGQSLEFEFSPRNTGAKIWFDTFEIIRSPHVLQQISYDIPSDGNSVTLSARILGDDLSYQWFKDGAKIADANDSTFTITNYSAATAGNYHLEASNSHGTKTTANATVRSDILDTIVQSPLRLSFTGSAKTKILTPSALGQSPSLIVETDTTQLWGFETLVTGPVSLDTKYNLGFALCYITVGQERTQFPVFGEIDQSYSHFIPQGTHLVKFSLDPSSSPYSGVFTEIKTTKGPIAKLKPSDQRHYNEIDVPLSEYAGAEPLTLKWYKDGALISTQTNLTSGQSYPYNRPSSPLDHGDYHIQVIDKNGLTATSEKIPFNQMHKISQVIDYTGDRVYLYDQGFTRAYFDNTQVAAGSSSLALEGPFDRLNSTSVTLQVNATHAVLKVRSQDFPDGSTIRYLNDGQINELAANADWQEITVQTQNSRIALHLPRGDENSTLWIDQLSSENKYVFRSHPHNITTYIGANVEFQASAYAESSSNSLQLTWLQDGKEVQSDHWNRLRIESVQQQHLGQYVARATTPDGEFIYSRPATLSLTEKSLSSALGYPTARITTVGNSPWVVDYKDSIDGASSVVSSPLKPGEYSSISIEIDDIPAWGIYHYTHTDQNLNLDNENRWHFQNAVYDHNLDTQKISLSISEYGDETSQMNRYLRLDGVRVTRFGDAQYQNWIEEKTAGKIIPSVDTSKATDLDKDGLPNWLEFALNLDPTIHDSLPTTNISRIDTDRGNIQLQFFAARSNDYSISYEVSADLVHWQPVRPSLEVVSSSKNYDEIKASLPPPQNQEAPFFARWTIHSLSESGQDTSIAKGE